jgi:O-antigen biosynthesis protein
MKTSIVILTLNQLPLTIQCLESIWKNTSMPYELILVDNGSKDGTIDYLRSLGDRIILIENPHNLGFAKGCNQGTEVASGDQILFLNNDTILPPGWLEPMVEALYSDDDVGIVGPVTNYISGQQKIPVPYTDVGNMEQFARAHMQQHKGNVQEVRRIVGFCLMARRSLLEDIGVFDERYGLGNYEDDDLCLRAIRAGYKLLIAWGSFIHHIGHASMGQSESSTLGNLLEINRVKSHHKWGLPVHELLYSPVVRISACLITSNSEDNLEATLSSLLGAVDEIIVVDLHSSDGSLNIARKYATRVVALKSAGSPRLEPEMMYQLATGDYLLWLEPGDILDTFSRRRMAGLKKSLYPGYDIVTVPFGNGPRYLTAKYLHKVDPQTVINSPETAYFRYQL